MSRLGAADFAFLLLLVAFCLVWSATAGMDLNWDFGNYHYYGALSLFEGRLTQDFMAASWQSYLNPLSHVPTYLMIAAGWHSVAVAAVLTLLHAAAPVLLYLTARSASLFPGRHERLLAIFAALLGLATLPFLNVLGSTFVDITTSLPVLAAVFVYSGAALRAAPRAEALAVGALIGFATGLKLTMGIYGVAAALWCWWAGASRAERVRWLLYFAAGAVAGGLLGGGYWAWLLWREFGNPVFPLFNAIFRSPDFVPVNLHFARFTPRDPLEAFAGLFLMVLPEPRLYSEIISPDLRVPLLLVLSAVLGVAALRRRVGAAGTEPRLSVPGANPRLIALGAFYFTALVLWVWTTFNARYAMPLLLLAGPLVAAALCAVFPARYALAAVAALLVAQVALVVDAGESRWTPHGWTKRWISMDVPHELRDAPALYLSVENQPNAFIAGFVHPQSAFINLRGQYALSLDAPGGKRVRRLLDAHDGRLRTLNSHRFLPFSEMPEPEWIEITDSIYAQYGLRMRPYECLTIANAQEFDALTELLNRFVSYSIYFPHDMLMSCPLERVPVSEDFLRERREVDRIFDAVERACPKLFTPRLAVSERIGKSWSRYYLTTELTLVLEDGALHMRSLASMTRLALGRESEWRGATAPFTCDKVRLPRNLLTAS